MIDVYLGMKAMKILIRIYCSHIANIYLKSYLSILAPELDKMLMHFNFHVYFGDKIGYSKLCRQTVYVAIIMQ